MRLPLFVKTRRAQRPNASLYYEVAANGLFQVRDTSGYRAVTRVRDTVPGLLAEKEQVWLRFPLVPRALLEEVLVFFREVYEHFGGEAIVILFYDSNAARFRQRVPWQTLLRYRDFRGRWRASGRLRYVNPDRPSSCVRFGTIHSHGDLPAGASAVDCRDEQFEDGLHVVFGHLHQRVPSRSACFVANGVRFPLDPGDALEPCVVRSRRAPREWMARVRCEEEGGSPAPASAAESADSPGSAGGERIHRSESHDA